MTGLLLYEEEYSNYESDECQGPREEKKRAYDEDPDASLYRDKTNHQRVDAKKKKRERCKKSF